MADDVSANIGDARALAHRLLDPGADLHPSELGADALPTLSSELLPGSYDDWLLLEAAPGCESTSSGSVWW